MTGGAARPHPLALLGNGPCGIAYLGNSVTAQRGGFRDALHALLCGRTGFAHRAVNAGFGGVGSTASLCLTDMLVAPHRPALCFVECLTGDIGVGMYHDCAAVLAGMVAKLDAIGAQPCFLLLPRDRQDTGEARALAATYHAVALGCGVPAIDLRHRWADLAPLLRDGVHTTEPGGRCYAEAIVAALEGLPVPAPAMVNPTDGPDYSTATSVPARPWLHADAPLTAGRFAHLPYSRITEGESVRLRLGEEALLGLMLVQGPHAGEIAIDGVPYMLRDRWCHYERLHAFVLPKEIGPARTVELRSVSGELRLARLLIRRTRSRPAPLPGSAVRA